MKISFFGVCASPILAGALKEIMPAATILGFEAAPVQRNQATEAVERQLAESDIVFCQEMPPAFGDLSFSKQKEKRERVFRIPSISFTGFHPDCVYLIHEGKQYSSPLGPYNSALVAAAFSQGRSVIDAVKAFNEETFAKLGYFSEFAKAKAFLKAEFAKSELDLDSILSSANRRIFMHTINHPKGWFIRSLAQRLAIEAGLFVDPNDDADMVVDNLAFNTIWPVYPAIAEKIGVAGNYLFKKAGFPDPTTGAVSFLTLEEFVDASYKQYKEYPTEVFQIPAVTRVVSGLEV